ARDRIIHTLPPGKRLWYATIDVDTSNLMHLKPTNPSRNGCIYTCAMGRNLRKGSGTGAGAGKLVKLPCACATLRRTARLVSQLYEEALRTTGVGGPQFTLLQALKLAPGISQKELGEILGIDSTTLTRTLALLRKRGWLSAEPGTDRRALRLGLTKTGDK